jgi:microcystin-dependent protein
MVSDPFVAEIRIFAGNFAPTGWAFCNGQLMPISQNTALFSLLGTTYGGDGKSTFALPNLELRAPLQAGQGPGLSERYLGEMAGAATHSMQANEMPVHHHALQASASVASTTVANGNLLATVNAPNPPYHDANALAAMGPGVLGTTGGGAPHQNMQPYLALTFIIALQGIFPPRS